MEWRDLLLDGYSRIPDFLEHTLEGLNREECDWRARPETNSIGWLCWHLIRQQDRQIADLMEEEQLWLGNGWHVQFNRPPDAKDSGFGHTPVQAAAFLSPDPSVYVRYSRAVTDRSIVYIRSLSEIDLGRELDEPWFQPLPTVGVRLVSILEDSMLHAGQAAFVRGLIQGKGWQMY